MNQYFVVDTTSGQKYGPADLTTLKDWAAQGRVTPETILEDSATGNQTPASAIQGIFLQGASPTSSQQSASDPGSTQSSAQAYTPPSESYGGATGFERPPSVGGMISVSAESQKFVTNAWIGFALGVVICCLPVGYIAAIIYGNKAIQAGNEGGKLPKILGIVFLILTILGIILYMGAIMAVIAGAAASSASSPRPI